jgi:hypothetical protein
LIAVAPVTDRGAAVAAGAVEAWIGGWPTATGALTDGIDGMLVEGTFTDGTLGEGTFRPGTLTPATLTPATLRPGAVTAGTATMDGAPGTDTAPATVLTEAPSAAPQRPTASAFAMVCRRLRRCASMFSHRALPSMRLLKKDSFALRVGVASSMAERGGDDSPS